MILLLSLAAAAFGANAISASSNQTITHNQSNAVQAFSEQTWSLTSTDTLGSSVSLTAASFANGSQKADCKLTLRVLSSSGLATWATVVSTSTTATAVGVNSATVSARSVATGNGTLGLTVTFNNTTFSTLSAGNYTTTVTGTISAN